jgi:hypothetical protein
MDRIYLTIIALAVMLLLGAAGFLVTGTTDVMHHAEAREGSRDDRNNSAARPSRKGAVVRAKLPRNTGTDGDGVAQTEADHFGNCPVCGAFIDMRDLGQVLAHVHDQEIELGEGDNPPPRESPAQ